MQAHLLQPRDVPAGQLTLWFANKATQRAVVSAPLDERPLTADQSAHIDTIPTANPDGSDPAPWIGLSCLIEGSTRSSIAETLSRYVDRREIMRSIFDTDEFDGTARSLLPIGTAAFEPLELGELTSQENFNRLSRHLAREARCTSWPYAGFATIETNKGTFLFAAFDHMVFDGYSLYISLDEFPRLHAGVLAGDSAPASALSHADFAHVEHNLATALGADSPELATWKNALNERRELPGLPRQAGIRDSERHPHEFISIPILDGAESAQVKARFRDRDVSTGFGFLSILLGNAASLEADRSINFLVSTHNRPSPAWGESVGWFAGVVPMSLRLAENASAYETYVELKEQWQDSQFASVLRMPDASRRLSATIEPALVVSYMEGRHAPGAEHWERNHAKALLGPTPPSSQIHLWINSMPNGTFLEVRFPNTRRCKEWILSIAAQTRETLIGIGTRTQEFDDCSEDIPCK